MTTAMWIANIVPAVVILAFLTVLSVFALRDGGEVVDRSRTQTGPGAGRARRRADDDVLVGGARPRKPIAHNGQRPAA